jgi:hypothetical protein
VTTQEQSEAMEGSAATHKLCIVRWFYGSRRAVIRRLRVPFVPAAGQTVVWHYREDAERLPNLWSKESVRLFQPVWDAGLGAWVDDTGEDTIGEAERRRRDREHQAAEPGQRWSRWWRGKLGLHVHEPYMPEVPTVEAVITGYLHRGWEELGDVDTLYAESTAEGAEDAAAAHTPGSPCALR